jgi:hypothetical protein
MIYLLKKYFCEDEAMNLKHFTDETLHNDLGALFKGERVSLVKSLYYLREIQSRKMFSSYKYESLQDYLVFEFGLSEDQAWRRIDVIKLLEDLPELEEKVKSGAHTLTNLNLAHALFKKEEEFADKPFTKEEKLEILGTIERLPKRLAAKILLGYSSVPTEMVKNRKLEITLDELANNDEIQGKLKKLRGLLAHSDPELTIVELINKLCDLGIKEWDPGQRKPKVRKTSAPEGVWKVAV